MKSFLLYAFIVLGSLQFSTHLIWAQDSAGQTEQTASVSEQDVQGEQKSAAQPVVQKTQPVPQKPVVQKAAPVVALQTVDGLTAIEVNEGDFRYSRIQGITFPKKDQMTASQDTSVKVVDAVQEKTKSINFTSFIIWGIVLGISLLIFFMYRFGKKKRRGNVFRRFP
jgi:hypothetical protein